MKKRKFNPARGGHAPGHIRDEFLDLLEGDWTKTFVGKGKLLGVLWNCSDQLGQAHVADLVDGFQLDQREARNFRRTYAAAVRLLKPWLTKKGVALSDPGQAKGRSEGQNSTKALCGEGGCTWTWASRNRDAMVRLYDAAEQLYANKGSRYSRAERVHATVVDKKPDRAASAAFWKQSTGDPEPTDAFFDEFLSRVIMIYHESGLSKRADSE